MAKYEVIDGFRINHELGEVYPPTILDLDPKEAAYHISHGRIREVIEDTNTNKSAKRKTTDTIE